MKTKKLLLVLAVSLVIILGAMAFIADEISIGVTHY